MTPGDTEETCGGLKEAEGRTGGGGGGGGGGNMKLSFTTLSTIAIQAGQSQIVVSVLKSGSVVHLQLVQVHPGLCEIGSNQEENQTLIQEQQQLMEKLKKHEEEVLSVVEKSRRMEQRKRRDEGMVMMMMMAQKKSKKQEEEDGLQEAMVASLNEGWSLLLRLLERRQEVLKLASEFYCRALEFAVSIDRLEDLQIRPDIDRRAEVQLTFDSVRRDLLGKSLQVLTSSSVLLQKLRQLQRTEALQRRGGGLQDEEEDDEEVESSRCSRGMALRLEELVETLQDRRRRADQAVRLQLQQEVHKKDQESRWAGSEDWSLTEEKIPDQIPQSGSKSEQTRDLQSGLRLELKPETRADKTRNLQPESTSAESTDLKSDSRTHETKDLQTGSGSDVEPGSRSEETRDLLSGFRLELKSGSRTEKTRNLPSDLKSDSRPQENRDLHSGSRSDVMPGSRSEESRDLKSESTSAESTDLKSDSRTKEKDLQTGSRSDVKAGSRSEETKEQSGFGLDLKSGSKADKTKNVKSGSGSAESTDVKSDVITTKELQPESILKPGSRSEETQGLQSGSKSVLQSGFRLEMKPGSRSEETGNLQSESTSSESTDLKSDSRTEETKDLQSGSRLGVKSGSRSEETRDLQSGSRSDFKPGFRFDLKSGSRSAETKNLQPESTSAESTESDFRTKETKDLQTGSRSDVEPRFSLGLKSGSRSEDTRDLLSGLRLELKSRSRSEETRNLQSGSKSAESTDLKSDSRTEKTKDLQSGSRSEETGDLQFRFKPGFRLELKSGSRSAETRNLQSESTSAENTDLKPDSRTKEKDLQTGSRSNMKSGSRSEETRVLQSGFKSDLQPAFRLDVRPGSRSEIKAGSRSEESRDLKSETTSAEITDLKSDSRTHETKNLQPVSRSDVEPGSRSEETKEQSGFGLDLKSGSKADKTKNVKSGSGSAESTDVKSDVITTKELQPESILKPGSRSEETQGLQSGSKSVLQSGFRLEMKPGSRSEETGNLQSESASSESTDLKSDSRTKETKNMQSGSGLDVKPETRSDVRPRDQRSEENKGLQSGSKLDLKHGFRLGLKSESRSEETRNLQSESTSAEITDLKSNARTKETKDLQPGSKLDLKHGFSLGLKSGSRSEETGVLQSGSKSDLQPAFRLDVRPGSRPEESRDLQSGSRSEAEHVSLSERSRKQEVSSSYETDDHAHQTLLTNQRQQLLSSCEQLVDKMWRWVQQGSSMLSNSSEAGGQLSDAEKTLNTHLQLRTQAESAGHDAESMKQILDQIRALHADSGPRPPGEPGTQLSPLKALTEQLKRGSKQTRTGAGPSPPGPPAADPTASLSPELATRVDLVLKELQSLNMKIDSNLQLLQPYVSFLRTAQQVEEEMEELREVYIRRPEEEEEDEDDEEEEEEEEEDEEEEEEEEEEEDEEDSGSSNLRTEARSSVKQDDACWQETLQKLLDAQELGNNYVNTVSTASGAGLNRQSAVSAVRRTLQRLSRTKQEVTELLSQQRVQIQQQQEYCRKYQERLLKTVQDFTCVSELLDSCTLMDLGSDLQTSRLLDHFRQARPHFTQLDAEVDYMEKSWETLRGVQETLGVKQLEVTAVKVEDLSELLELQKKVKNKIHQSESILDLTSSFHLTSQQLEAELQADSGLTGSSEAELSRHREEQQQIQNLFKTASKLKTDICTAVNHSGWTCFRVEQLEARLLSLDSLCVSWLNEASRREDKLRRELLTSRLNEDINQLRDSFKELKKRFSNLKFNYLKRNDRTRNTKAVRNQLQQVEMYKEKLQVLRKRLQGVTARLGSEVKDGGVTREVEDAVNELQRQMGDFERSVSEHQKTLEMTRRLQQAMEEYQFWCEEASATIARVGKFSSECRSTEAVSVLYRQFEKFVWPTVPQQEERISQIAELAVRLHGAEEGRRYIEKTVSKHSEMVESIKELSDGLMKLEAKLKLESLKKQNDGEKKVEGETERRSENETEDKDEDDEKKLKENRKMKKKEPMDNRSSQEAADMYELKETGHTPELTEHDGKEVPVKRQSAANRKPPLQKTDRQVDRQQLSSYSSTFSLSCSPVEANRRIHTINSQSQPAAATEPEATPHPSVIGPLFSDIQREFQRTETLQDASAGGLPEVELMTEDSLSNDEYECVSPDDISLPPLAETPESFMVQSDVEEGFCFSSHSVHINQYSHQYRAQSDHSGTGSAAVRQQRESSQTESCPTPPTSHHGSTRFRSGSSLFVQSPLTVPAPSHQVTSISILRATETSPANIRQSADPSPELNLPSAYKDNKVPEKRSPSQSESSLKEQRRISTQGGPTRTQGGPTQNVASRGETLPQIDPIPQAPEFNHSPSILQPFNGRDPDLHKDKTPQQETTFPKSNADCFPQSLPDLESRLNHDLNSSQTSRETSLVSKPESNCTFTQQTIYLQSSSSNSQCTLPPASSSLSSTQESLLPQTETLPQLDPVSKVRKDKDRTQEPGFLKSCATCPQTSTAIAKDSNLLRSCPGSRSGLDLDAASSQTSKDCMSQSSRPCTATKSISISVSSRNLRSQQGSASSPQGNGGPPEAHAPIPPEPNSSSSNRLSSKQSHQTVYLTSTCSTQQCVHGPGMTPSNPAKPTAPSQPESQTQALAQQANLHVIPLSSPSHLLTPDQDPNICQPMAIREEIRLTPQIQGPPFPAPPPQAESLPQGKASKPGPPCFTRPLSRATVMEGSPVTLEVAVTEHPEPRLTWFNHEEVSATGPSRGLTGQDRKHDERPVAGNGCSGSGDTWLVAEVFDIISADWQTWFGTLCVLLWLLCLIVL